MSRTVAVMQPYLYPYAGYYRLLAQADEFVLLDDVQFPRRGRVHRCQVPGPAGAEEWLTLPLARQERDTSIAQLRFADDARESFDQRLHRLPWFESARGPLAAPVRAQLCAPMDGSVCDFLEDGLRLVASLLRLPVRLSRSSELQLSPALRGQERIIAIARARAASDYLNAPGGRALYDEAGFEQAGLKLHFLPDYEGPFGHFLPALLAQSAESLRADIASAR